MVNGKHRECECSNTANHHDSTGWMCDWCWSKREVVHEIRDCMVGVPDPDSWREGETERRRELRMRRRREQEVRAVRRHYSAATAAFMLELHCGD
jgi:hypothetical protein